LYIHISFLNFNNKKKTNTKTFENQKNYKNIFFSSYLKKKKIQKDFIFNLYFMKTQKYFTFFILF